MLSTRREPYDFLYEGKPCSCCPLTEEELAGLHRVAEEYGERLRLPDSFSELSQTLAEYGAVASAALRDREGGQIFADPAEALEKLSLDELCAVYDAFCQAQGLSELGAWDDRDAEEEGYF